MKVPLAGAFIMLMIGWTIMSELIPNLPSWPSGIFACLAGALLITRLALLQTLQIAVLFLAGSGAIIGGLLLGREPSWLSLLDTNTKLLTMLGAVSFLRLIAMRDEADTHPASYGMNAFRRTMLGVALFGGFINISAPVLVADHLSRRGNLSHFAAQSITRVFTGGATWSPFFAGMAVVLTYIGKAKLVIVMATGIPFAILGLLLVLLEAKIFYKGPLQDFEGYPITWSGLWVPIILAFGVGLGHFLLPKASILIIIAFMALLISIGGAVHFHGWFEACRKVRTHILSGLHSMVGELLLFLAAGVLTVGLSNLAAAAHLKLPFIETLSGGTAGLILAAIVAISAIGVHPIISIAVMTPLIAPLGPDPQLLAITYVFGWSLGTCASPLSGINLIIQGRYGISSFRAAIRNWPFVAVMYIIALLFLQTVALIRGA